MKPLIIVIGLLLLVPQYLPSQYSNPLDEGVEVLPPQDPPPDMDWPTQPYDWDVLYHNGTPNPWPPPPSGNWQFPRSAWWEIPTNDPQYNMSYLQFRSNLSSILLMYKTTKDAAYLNEFVNQANPAFQAPYFNDGDNGLDDGFLGWAMHGYGTYQGGKYLGESLERNTWYSVRVEVKDTMWTGAPTTLLRTLFDGELVYETFFANVNAYIPQVYYPRVYNNNGTVALLSGWASTRFRNIVVRDQADIFYDLNSSLSTFDSDWSRVRNPDHSTDTGEWGLDQYTGEISCDATTNGTGFYYPYNPGDPQNHGIPPDGSGDGKYAALVLVRAGATSLRNCQIDFEMLIEKRNNFGAENGVGVRWHAVPPDPLTEGERVWARNQFFAHKAKWLSAKVRPDVLVHGVYDGPKRDQQGNIVADNFHSGGVNYADVEQYDRLLVPTTGWLRREALKYDAVISSAVLDFVETVYEENLSAYYATADFYLERIQNNIVAKWYVKEGLNVPDFIRGDGSSPTQYGGWRADGLQQDMAGMGLGRLCSRMSRISKTLRWLPVTQANPSPSLPSPELLSTWYDTVFSAMARLWVSRTWIENGSRGQLYDWNSYRHFYGEFAGGSSDLLHSANQMEFLMDAYEAGILSRDEIEKVPGLFINNVWNGQSGDGIFLHCWLWGGDTQNEPWQDTRYNWDRYITLSKVDFRIWECANDFTTRYHDVQFRHYYYYLHEALLLYFVKYGIPRDFHVSAISPTSVELAWSNPSDYPASPERPDGTGLRYFNIYRRVHGEPWSSTPYAQMTTASHTFADNDLDPMTTYQYKIRSQDWTARYRNESDDSNILTVYQGNVVDVATLELAMQNRSTSPSATWNNSSRHLAIKDGLLHEVFTSEGQIFYRRQNISTGTWEVTHWVASSTNNGGPSVCVDHNNTVHVVWQRSLSTYNFALWYARSSDNGTTWSTPTILPGCTNVQVSSTQLSIYPVIAEWNNQRLVVVFCSTAGLMYTTSNDGGANWGQSPTSIPSNYNPNYWVWYPSLASISNYLSLTYDYRYNGVWSRVYNGTSWSTEANVNSGTGMFFDRLSSVSNNGQGVPIAAWCAQLSYDSGYRIMYREGTPYNSWGWWTRFDAASNYSDFYPSVSAMYWGDGWYPAIAHSNNYQWVLFKQYNPGWKSWDDCLMSTSGHWANVSAVGNTIEQPMATWTNQASNPYLIELYSGFCGEGEGNEMLATSQYEQHRSVVIQHKGNRSWLSFEMLPMQVITTGGDTVAVPFETHRAGEPVSTNLDSVWEYVGTESFILPDNVSRLILETSITAMANRDTSGRVGTNSFTSRSFEVHLHRGNSRTLLWTNTTGTSGRFEADVRQFAGQSVIIKPFGIIPNGLRNQVDVGVGDVLVRKDSPRNAPLSKSESALLPTKYNLSQNYPNPFNPSTQINYDLPEPAQVSLALYDVLGRRVAELASGYREAGYYSVTWNAGAQLASGVYLARFAVANEQGRQIYAKSMKLMLMK